MGNALTITVVTANFNNAHFLCNFFESLTGSTRLPTELVFVDDASTDNSIEKVNELNQKLPFKLTLIVNNKNQGFANSLNIGIAAANCDLITRIDPDDFIHPRRIEKEVEYLEKNPEISVIGSNTFYYSNFQKKIIGTSHFPSKHEAILSFFKKGFIALSNGSYTARREVLQNFKYSQSLVPFEEYAFFSQILYKGYRVANLTEPLTYYRLHGQQRTFRFIHKNQKGIADVREKVWQSKTSSFQVLARTTSNFIYWKGLMAKKAITTNFFMLLVLPFRLVRLIIKLLN